VVDFTESTTPVCRSSVVSFSNASTPAGLPVTWFFGDDSTSMASNPSHKYADTGSFNVTLITDNNGCQDTLTKPGFIKVLGPVARFNYSVDCANESIVNFRDSSLVYGPPAPVPTYTWSFGDPANTIQSGTPLLNPLFTYPPVAPGGSANYTVQLVVNDGTCQDTAIRTIRLVNEIPNFTIKSPACRNEVIPANSTNSPTNVQYYIWIANKGPDAGNPSYNITYPNTGVFPVQLDIIDINGCYITGTPKNVTITGPTVDFSIVNDGGCKQKPVAFADNSTSGGGPITKWSWNFGDGSTGPFNTSTITHSYTDTGLYNVTLTAIDALGCSDALTKADTITSPLAAFGTDTTLFCPGGPMLFKDSSLGRRIDGWTWDFGDGGGSTVQNPHHTYTGGDSVYSVKLVVTDAFGCSDSTTRNRYVSIRKPKPAFGVKDSSSICPPLETYFFFQGTDYQSYYWDFGDGGSSTLQNPTHFFNSYGSDTVKLYLVGFGGCLDSAENVVNIYNPGLYTSVTSSLPTTNCNDINVNFTFTIPPGTISYFYFGDGLVDSSQQQALTHFYNSPAFYNPSVAAVDVQGCIANAGGPVIKVLGAIPIFGMDIKKFCDSGIVNFTNYTVNNDPIVSETWGFGDGDSTVVTTPVSASHDYLAPGLYVTSLTATTQAGCVKALTDTLRVLRTPDPQISSVNSICVNGTIDFQGNLAIPDTAISWNWDLGNGQGSTQQQTSGTYNTAGKYTVRLQAANSLGCKDTTSETIVVNPPPSIKVNGDTVLMVGSGINIPMLYSSGVVSYNWTPATNLSCTDCASPYANPQFTTTYQVTVTDSNDCSSSRYVTLITLCNNKNFFIPNTFSPNGDGVNDVFYPRGTGIDRIQAMRIFDRWGEPVFEKRFFPANDPTSGWDGTYKGKPANSDTYIYMIDIICENATIITYKGNVTLIR
jgi:gliding motility-associated-like protein